MSCFHTLTAWRNRQGEITFKRPNDFIEEMQLPCGKCIGCKLDKANDWATRCFCEASNWKDNCFITLTYDDKHLPKNGYLKKSHVQKFLKLFRYYHTGKESWINQKGETERPIRYICVGEYGPNGTRRPHYHLILFNYKPNDLEFYKFNKQGDKIYKSKDIKKIWKKGFITVEDLNYKTACYCARYCNKKLIEKTDPKILKKLKIQPEFLLCSRNGGIGIKYWKENKEKILKQGILIKIDNQVKMKQIPKYFERKYKEEIGDKEYKKYTNTKTIKAIKSMKETLSKTDLTESEYKAMMERNLIEKTRTLSRNNFI